MATLPCNFESAGCAKVACAVTDGRPSLPWAFKPVPQLGSPSAVPSNPNSRRGRSQSPILQGRDEMDMLFIGIDVSKDHLDVHVLPTAESFFVARTDAGLDELIARLRNFGVAAAIAVEATGGFERIVAAGLASANLPGVIVNPAQVRDFAKALGKRAKTDPNGTEAALSAAPISLTIFKLSIVPVAIAFDSIIAYARAY